MRKTTQNLTLVVVILLAHWLAPGASAVEGLLATHSDRFSPVTLEAGRPKFHLVSVFYEGGQGPNDALLLARIRREQDGLGLAWMETFRSQEPAWNKDREALGRFLWWDPDQKPMDPATLPTTRLFPTSGHVTMRSDWGDEATFATFRCGRFGEIDGTWGRNNADNLSFTIRKRGPLALDSGPVHGQNTTVLKFLGEGGDAAIPAIGNYGRQTIAHNSITVGEGEYVHHDYRGKPTGNVVRRGGQSVPQMPDWWAQWGFSKPQSDFMEGRITAYRTHPLYDYACGDARFSYPPEWGIEEITRQFVIRLNRTGQRGGAIAIQDPQSNLDQSLPLDVEDHWRHFRNDPHFQAWVTDPRYRVVIEPTEQDR